MAVGSIPVDGNNVGSSVLGDQKEVVADFGVVPWVIAFIGPILTYYLGKLAKGREGETGLVVKDIEKYKAEIEEISRLVAIHQAGRQRKNQSFAASREEISGRRKEARRLCSQIKNSFSSEAFRLNWENEYFRWKEFIDGETGLILGASNVWSEDAIRQLEESNSAYLAFLASTRRKVAGWRIKLSR